jgi:SPP1 gp7 family putative phage head morphogenesis protein
MPRTPKPTTWTVSRDADTQFIEAAKWFLGRVPMTKDRWSELTERAQRKAFTVAGVAQADVLNSVFRAVDSAVAKGTTLADFKREVGPKLESQWQGTVANPPWRLETIFRTNVQMAYSSGRIRQMKDPAVSKVRPFWLYDSVLDTRTSEICRPLAGTVLAADDPFWKTHVPPSHFGCRSGIRALRKSQAEARGITSPPPNAPAAKGFGNDPDESEWAPDLNRYPPELREQVRKRLDEMPDPKPMAMPNVVSDAKAKPLPNAKNHDPGNAGADGDPPPWFTDGKPRPRGKLDESIRPLGAKERRIAEVLLNQGNDVKTLIEKNRSHDRIPDLLVNGEAWFGGQVELKALTATADNALKAMRSRILKSLARGGQASNVIYDAIGYDLTREDVDRLVLGLAREIAKRQEEGRDYASIRHIRIISNGLDLTYSHPQA